MLATQEVILGRYTGGAVVQVANTQVFTAQRDHRRGAETEAFSTQNRRFDDVEAGLQTTIGLQTNFVPQAVNAQRLMHLGQAQLPRGTGVLDGGERACRRAAIVARHSDQIRIGFGDAGRNSADPWLGDEFHRDLRVWVDLLEVKDQLRQVFDGVNIVVRRRRNQRDAGHRVAQAGNQLIDLTAR